MSNNNGNPEIPIRVIVTKTVDPVSGQATYKPEYDPKTIPVKKHNTVLNFKLDQPTPDDVVVTSVTCKQIGNDQLGPPEISSNGKKVKILDANTVKETLNLHFEFGSKKQEQLTKLAVSCEVGDSEEYPEILNDPPP